jgi:phosphoglycerate dehydrogenase-like enzyme
MVPELYRDIVEERLPSNSVRFDKTPRGMRKIVADAEIATGFSIDEAMLEAADNLRLFHCPSAGVNHLPLDRIRDRNITVTNASGVHAPSVSEHVVGWMLMFARRLHEGLYRQQDQEWRHFQAGELNGSTVTVVGLGAIGTAIADRLETFNVDTIGVRYTPTKGGPTDNVVGFDGGEFHDALSETDYLAVASPLTETTRGLLSTREFQILPPNAVLINAGRGPIVDTDALVSAIRNNDIRGAALDVTDPEPLPENHPLWNFRNVLITPHMAGHTNAYWDRTADILVENVDTIEQTGEYTDLRNQVIP